MIKYVTYKKLEKENGPLVTRYGLYFIDPELESKDFDFVESQIKESFNGFVELDPENCEMEYIDSIPYIKVTIKISSIRDLDMDLILEQTKDWFIDQYNNVILINLKNKK